MNILKNKYIDFLPPIIATLLFIVALWDFFYSQDWVAPILTIYAILLMSTLILGYYRITSKPKPDNAIKAFEKSLKGSLTHFKCPNCSAIFAIKKSKINNKKNFIISCPSCMKNGIIATNPIIVHGKIPFTKSPLKKYECSRCGERVTIWTEGSDFKNQTTIYSCPYCGSQKPLYQVST